MSLLLVGLFPLPSCSIRSAPGNYGNVAGRCQDVGSLEVGVQLRPPPVFITAGLPSPHRGPGHAGSVFPNRERSDSPLRFQNKPQSRGEGGILTLKALFEQVFSTGSIHFLQKMCVHGSACVKKEKEKRSSDVTSDRIERKLLTMISHFKQFRADWVVGFERALLQQKSISNGNQSCESPVCVVF